MRYVVLDTWEKFSISPLEWDKLDKQTQIDCISKRNLDIKQANWEREQAKNSSNKG